MIQARANNPLHANLPEYIGSGEQTKARDIVAGMTGLPAEKYIRYLDANVEAKILPGCKLKSIQPYGSAYWTRTAAISTVHTDGTPRDFFLKLARTDVGNVNLRGEFETIKAISEAVPDFVPVPIAVGTYKSDDSVHFYLASFVDMTDEVPEPEQLPAKLAELHTKAISPSGKYGFLVPTSMGAHAQQNKWTSSWEKSFTTILDTMFGFEQHMHGVHEEMQQMHEVMLTKVIPRLLRPLKTGSREIQPRLVHGNLWDGNASVNATTDKPIIFDASGMYTHNEYELGAWNQPRHKIYRAYIQEYQRHFPASQPEEDVEDRLILYRLRFNLTSSACHLSNMRFRDLAVADTRYLSEKYKEGYQGAEDQKAEV